jgi:hypothetical protein
MKLAVGGAVAAGVFVAPRVEGFSLVPDYASAASGEDQSPEADFTTTTFQAAAGPLCGSKCCVTCWNSTGVTANCSLSTCTCGSNKSCGNSSTDAQTGALVVNKNSPPGSTINLNYALWGPTEGCSNETPALNMTLAGVSGAFESCDLSVTGSCTVGTFSGGTSLTPAANGVQTVLNPSCTGSLGNSVPANSRCPATASVSITLACTFT